MPAGPGRPPKTDDDGVPTRERLLAAAAAAFVERGFEGVTLADIARRAEVSTPAIYNHFDGKTELIVAACRWALEGMGAPIDNSRRDPVAVVRRYLSDDFADARRLQLELHLASMRHPDVADMLAKWHGDNAREWADKLPGDPDPLATVKVFYLLLLGLAQVDALSSLDVPRQTLTRRVEALVRVLFAEGSASPTPSSREAS